MDWRTRSPKSGGMRDDLHFAYKRHGFILTYVIPSLSSQLSRAHGCAGGKPKFLCVLSQGARVDVDGCRTNLLSTRSWSVAIAATVLVVCFSAAAPAQASILVPTRTLDAASFDEILAAPSVSGALSTASPSRTSGSQPVNDDGSPEDDWQHFSLVGSTPSSSHTGSTSGSSTSPDVSVSATAPRLFGAPLADDAMSRLVTAHSGASGAAC